MATFLRRYTDLPYLFDYLQTKELSLLSPKLWDDKNDSFFLERYARVQGFNSTYALCLAEASETYHHWKVFTTGSNGVCIEFKKDELVAHAMKIQGLRAESVNYFTIKKLQSSKPIVEQLPFVKRFAFIDEKEYRLFVARRELPVAPIRISVPTNVVRRVVLSPWMPKTVSDHLKATINEMDGCKSLRVYRSTLVENENWKKIGSCLEPRFNLMSDNFR